ncbi:MAG: L-threonylcarbamoyladenylate synthase [Pyrinomonadaceae bacterium]
MKTLLTSSPLEAAEIIKLGGIAAFPTETVYGLGADIFNKKAIEKVFEAKNRPADNPLIAHISSIEQIAELANKITETAGKLIESFFPGPVTIVLEKAGHVPDIATAGLDSIGIRMPRNTLASEFIAACRTPVVAPSANLSGRPSPTTWQAVYEDLDGRIDCILQGDATEIGLESTVVDCRVDTPTILRLGSVSLQDIQAVIPGAKLFGFNNDGERRSPGLKHKHYSPRASVVIWNSQKPEALRTAFIGLRQPERDFALIRKVPSLQAYAHELFEFFRECDRQEIEMIYCERVDDLGMGAALMDRIERASRAGN